MFISSRRYSAHEPAAAGRSLGRMNSHQFPVTASTSTTALVAPIAMMPRTPARPWPTGTLARTGLDAFNLLARASYGLERAVFNVLDRAGFAVPNAEETEERLASDHDTSHWWERPLRVGFAAPGPWADTIAAAPGAWQCEFLELTTGEAEAACRLNNLDCVIYASGPDDLALVTNEQPGREAAWYDWGQPRPASYPAIFPTRLDCARVTLPGACDRNADPILLRAIVELACVTSRHATRLSYRDRLNGRRPIGAAVPKSKGAVQPFHPAGEGLSPLMAVLHNQLRGKGVFAPPLGYERAAARVLSAWVATTASTLTDEFRRDCAETSARICADEPDTLLRAAAVRFSVLDDAWGNDAIAKADVMLQNWPIVTEPDQLAFVQSELDLGSPSPMTVGRLAAGICLVGARMSFEHLRYFKDDLLDDMKCCELLMERDQDHALLKDVFRTMEQNRGISVASGFDVESAGPDVAKEVPASKQFTRPVRAGWLTRAGYAAKAKAYRSKTAA